MKGVRCPLGGGISIPIREGESSRKLHSSELALCSRVQYSKGKNIEEGVMIS